MNKEKLINELENILDEYILEKKCIDLVKQHRLAVEEFLRAVGRI